MSFMGLSNSEVFPSQKDTKKPIKSKFLSIPTFEFLHDDHPPNEEQGEEFLKKKKILVSSTSESEEEEETKMMIKMPRTPPADQFKKIEEDEDNDGFRTPTSLDKKIRVINSPECPPAPKKPKSVPVSSSWRNKRKASSSSSRIYKIDLLKDVKLMISPHHHHHQQQVLVVHDHDLGSKIIKKVRTN